MHSLRCSQVLMAAKEAAILAGDWLACKEAQVAKAQADEVGPLNSKRGGNTSAVSLAGSGGSLGSAGSPSSGTPSSGSHRAAKPKRAAKDTKEKVKPLKLTKGNAPETTAKGNNFRSALVERAADAEPNEGVAAPDGMETEAVKHAATSMAEALHATEATQLAPTRSELTSGLAKLGVSASLGYETDRSMLGGQDGAESSRGPTLETNLSARQLQTVEVGSNEGDLSARKLPPPYESSPVPTIDASGTGGDLSARKLPPPPGSALSAPPTVEGLS